MTSVSVPEAPILDAGARIHAFIREVQPYVRSITGTGTRQTLAAIRARIPIEVESVASGSGVLDWVVPPEWHFRDAWIEDANGRRVIEASDSPLRVMSYSVPVRARMPLSELRSHLFTLPGHPDWIPYRTSYYQECWGFCLRQSELDALADGDYEVCIDSELAADGALVYGELVVPGESPDEVLISCHCCHPGLCNDNLSGIGVAIELARWIMSTPRRLSYRFLFVPGTIGSITWLARNEHRLDRIKHGLVLAGVGDRGAFTYKRSRRGGTTIDRAAALVLAARPHAMIDFEPYGYDERQYCSPGFDLPVGCLMRSKHGSYPEYHTSADDLAFVSADCLAESADVCSEILEALEGNARYQNLAPRGEPQLGRRGLYRALGGLPAAGDAELAMLWVLSFSDGASDLLDIAARSGLSFSAVRAAATALEEHALLRRIDEGDGAHPNT
jgi:aminopeptidase-like protein